MNYEFYFQDPTSAETVYLFEALVAAVHQANEWRGVFAFASQNGVQTLLTDPAVQEFFARGGRLELIVGSICLPQRCKDWNAVAFWERADPLWTVDEQAYQDKIARLEREIENLKA
ncbi:MAG TPA: hypothetical protein VI636_07585, partial [Candidatus Angelobacter sp.]